MHVYPYVQNTVAGILCAMFLAWMSSNVGSKRSKIRGAPYMQEVRCATYGEQKSTKLKSDFYLVLFYRVLEK